MEITVLRYNTEPDYTDGMLFIDNEFFCYTIEDGHRDVKVYGETRIPDGTYQLEFRTEGGFHQRYSARYGKKHKGMLWVRNVPGFEYILIHVGNTPEDTAGCLLVGDQPIRDEAFIAGSRKTYEALYPIVASAIDNGDEVCITYETIGS